MVLLADFRPKVQVHGEVLELCNKIRTKSFEALEASVAKSFSLVDTRDTVRLHILFFIESLSLTQYNRYTTGVTSTRGIRVISSPG